MRTKALAERAHEIQTTGLTGAYEKAFRDLEEKLAQAQGIVNARNATAAAVATLMELIEDLRYGCYIPLHFFHVKISISVFFFLSHKVIIIILKDIFGKKTYLLWSQEKSFHSISRFIQFVQESTF